MTLSRLDELLSVLCEGTLSAAEEAELEQLLGDSADARRRYAEYLTLHAELSWQMPAQAKLAEPAIPDLPFDVLLASPRTWREWFRQPMVVSLVTAAGVMAAVLGVFAALGVPQAVLRGHEPVYVARLSHSADCVWQDGGVAKTAGASLFMGQHLALLSGTALVTFDSGAQVILQGPADFVVETSEVGRLTQGKLTGRVPPAAAGFTILSPRANVIDRGTEFGLEVTGGDTPDSEPDTGLHVFQGSVDLETLDTAGQVVSTQRVKAGQAVRIARKDAQAVRPIALAPALFVREIPEYDGLPIPPAYVAAIKAAKPLGYWRCGRLDQVPNEMGAQYAAQIDGPLQLSDLEGNQSLVFDGRGGSLRIDEPLAGFGQGDYTLEAWMRPTHYAHSTLLSLHVPPAADAPPPALFNHHGVLELAPDAKALRDLRRIRFLHRSPPGAGGGANVYSAQRYELQQWQHVVALKRGDVLWLFLDGQPVASTTEPTSYIESPVLCIGKLLHPANRAERPFHGQLDEVAVYKRALSDDEVRAHFELVNDARRR